MSENQYDTKFVTTANTKPSTRPCAPPSASPRNRNSGAQRAEQQRGLHRVGHIVLYLRRWKVVPVSHESLSIVPDIMVAAAALLEMLVAAVLAVSRRCSCHAAGSAAVPGAASTCRGRRRPPAAAHRRPRLPAASRGVAPAAACAPTPRRPKRCSACRSIRARSSSRRTTPAAASASTSSASTASFVDLVTYYRNVLKQTGELVFDVPATHEFDIGRFGEETMAFPPGVTIKDFQSDVSQGYPNPKPGGQPARFPTIIQIVPVPDVSLARSVFTLT